MTSRSNRPWIVLSLLVCLATNFLDAQEFRGKVVGIIDGDTIIVRSSGATIDLRLNGIDAPEPKQPFGERAKQYVSALCFGDEVMFKSLGEDKYGRTLADVVLVDGRILNQELVKAGMAWHYKQYSQDKILAKLEQEARERNVGLWSDPQAIPPWEWRHETDAEGASALQPAAPGKPKPTAVSANDIGEQIVYVTRSGSKYHKAGCRYLSKSAIPMKLKEAAARYGPCGVCNPPRLNK